MRQNCHCESQVTVALSVTNLHPWAMVADGPLMPPRASDKHAQGTSPGTGPCKLGRATGARWGFRTRPAVRTNVVAGQPFTANAVNTPRMKALRGAQP